MSADKPISSLQKSLAAIALAAVSGLVGWIVPYLLPFAKPAWQATTDFVVGVSAHLVRSTPVPNWLLYLICGAVVLCVVVIVGAFISAPPAEPPYKQYRTDNFFGVKWVWRYSGDDPIGICPICPTCQTVLVYGEQMEAIDHWNSAYMVSLFCETCNMRRLHEKGDRTYLNEKIYRQIEVRLRTGTWQDSR